MSQCIIAADLMRVLGTVLQVVGFVSCLVGVVGLLSRPKKGEWDH